MAPGSTECNRISARQSAEPSTVLLGVESTESQWTQDTQRGGDYIVNLLNRYRASWAIADSGQDTTRRFVLKGAQRQKLERLVWDAIYALQKANLDSDAAKLRRALEKF